MKTDTHKKTIKKNLNFTKSKTFGAKLQYSTDRKGQAEGAL